MTSRLERWAVALLAFVLLTLSSLATFVESRPFFARARPLEQIVPDFLEGRRYATFTSFLESRDARNAWLGSCLASLKSITDDLSSSATTRLELTRSCLEIAERIIKLAPLSSNAWFIAAALSARLGDIPRLEQFLTTSYKTGPSEGWIAERRAVFAYRVKDKLSVSLREKMKDDFLLLLRTEKGSSYLAGLYSSDPQFREYLTSVAELTEPAAQERFLWSVRRTQTAPAD